MLSYLLVPNEQLTPNAIEWFSIFPLPIDNLSLIPAVQVAHEKVLKCLEFLASHWAVMRDLCGRRRYPPLVDEMVTLFKIDSFIFLQIIFRAILREIWTGQLDQCSQVTETVFPRNYTDVMARAKPQGVQSGVIQAYNLSIVTEYEHILETHRLHTLPVAHRNMAPPQYNQGQSRMAEINHTYQDTPHTRRSSSETMSQGMSQYISSIDNRAAEQSASRSASNPVIRPASASILPTIPVASQGSSSRQANSASPYHTLAQAGDGAPRSASLVQMSTNHQGFPSPVSFTHLPAQLQDQGQWRNHSSPFGIERSPMSPSQTARTRGPVVLPSNGLSSLPNGQYIQQQGPFEGYPQRRAPIPSPTNGSPYPIPGQQSRVQPEVRTTLSSTVIGSRPPVPQTSRFIHYDPSLVPAPPNPSYSALHQAHLSSPNMSAVDVHGTSNDLVVRFTECVIMPPEALSKRRKHLSWNFNIDPLVISVLAQDEPGFQGAPSTRTIKSGSRLCRIRCIKLAITAGLPSQSEWVVAENTWPEGIAVMLNGTALEVRRKFHYGKDLPIDATQHLRSGKNEMTTAVIGLPQGSSLRYAVGVELIRVQDGGELKRAIPSLSLEEARKRILDRSNQTDPDVQVVDTQTVIDLTDPFTARQFGIPIRALDCRHNQCFDRDVYLETRNAKNPAQPCEPEAFKCPICGVDARPPNLVVDGFLLAVRNMLQEKGRSKVRTIILDKSGNWEVGKEDEDTAESSDEEGGSTRPYPGGPAEARTGKAHDRNIRDVIEID